MKNVINRALVAKKRFISLLLAIVASVGMMFAQGGTCGENLTWDLTDSVLTISGTGAMTDFAGTDSFKIAIRDLIIENGVTSIGSLAFSNCYNMKSVTIGGSVTYIGAGAFWDCINMQATYMESETPPSVGYDDMFHGLGMLGIIHVPCGSKNAYVNAWGVNAEHVVEPEGCLPTPCLIASGTCGEYLTWELSCDSVLTISGTGEMMSSPWSLYSQLIKSVVINEGVTSIGSSAFSLSANLTSITIPNSITNISDSAFYGCSGLTSVVIPYNVTNIGYGAFYNIPNIAYNGTATGSPWGAKSVNGYVEGWLVYSDNTKTTLLGCSSAATGEITIPNSVTSIGRSAFYGCTHLTNVTIPNSVTSIGTGALYGCTGLNSVSISNSITCIEYGVFCGCSGLTSITVPNSVTRIENAAFQGCSALTSITCEATIPPSASDYAFWGVNTSIPVYVPEANLTTYKITKVWKEFTNILPIPGTEVCQSYFWSTTDTLCSPEDYYWNGHIVPYSGRIDTIDYWGGAVGYYRYPDFAILRDSFKTQDGCDSIYERRIYWLASSLWIARDTINEGEQRWVGNHLVTKSGVYYDSIYTSWGCDSIQEWHITILPLPEYTISTSVNNSKYGSVEGGGTFKRDTTITITAIPNKGYQFNQWSDGNTDNPRQIIVTQNSVFTAIFGVKMCSWLVESNDLEMGAVITSFENEFYKYGTQITVEASPNSGYKFVKWNDGKKYNPYKFSILDDKYLLAIFMEETEEQDTTTVTPTSTTATFTWPFIEGGFSYSLTIYSDAACTIPLCTITFNQYGQLVGITFASRAPRRYAEQEDGFTYTVSGLDANTEYYFKMETMDEDNKLINTDEGSFRTQNGATAIEYQQSDEITPYKVMINGQIFILRGDKTYTLQGQEVK